jgi:hypothetical protein
VKFILNEAPAREKPAAPAPLPPPPANSAPASEPPKPPQEPASFKKEDFKNDPLIKNALEVFKGRIVEVRS